MSSVQSAFAQIPAREKFLLCVNGATATLRNPGATKPESLVTTTAFAAATTGLEDQPTNGDLYADLGFSVMTYDATTNMHVARYVLAEKVANASAEGRSGVFQYICVWSADASVKVGFVRTG
jgi:hypothetical protein